MNKEEVARKYVKHPFEDLYKDQMLIDAVYSAFIAGWEAKEASLIEVKALTAYQEENKRLKNAIEAIKHLCEEHKKSDSALTHIELIIARL